MRPTRPFPTGSGSAFLSLFAPRETSRPATPRSRTRPSWSPDDGTQRPRPGTSADPFLSSRGSVYVPRLLPSHVACSTPHVPGSSWLCRTSPATPACAAAHVPRPISPRSPVLLAGTGTTPDAASLDEPRTLRTTRYAKARHAGSAAATQQQRGRTDSPHDRVSGTESSCGSHASPNRRAPRPSHRRSDAR